MNEIKLLMVVYKFVNDQRRRQTSVVDGHKSSRRRGLVILDVDRQLMMTLANYRHQGRGHKHRTQFDTTKNRRRPE